MPVKYKIFFTAFLFILLSGPKECPGQAFISETDHALLIDSLDNRISYLQQKLPALKESRDVSYYNVQRELDLTLFVKEYEEYITEEELDKARDFVESRLKYAKSKKDQYATDFYNRYREKIYRQLKEQRMYYQELLGKEKKFIKVYEEIIEPHDLQSFQKGKKMIELALRYASDNNFTETASYLHKYFNYNESLIFDLNNTYDLAHITSKPKWFEDVINPLVESDSLARIQEAENLLNSCIHYNGLVTTELDSSYLEQWRLAIATALSDLLSRAGREEDLEKYTDQSIKARLDTLNPEGVFKWNNYVVVIDEFMPTASSEAVKKGEAIIHADKMLATYLQKNKLCKSYKDLKYGYSFVIPFESNAKNSSFYFDNLSGKWQYIACYTVIVNESYTREVSKFMPPLYFEEELDIVQK